MNNNRIKDYDVRISSGLSNFDDILHGGFIPKRAYLVRGGPGTGKTTLGLHFLIDGAKEENNLFITLVETENEIRKDAKNRGFNIEKVKFLDLTPSSDYIVENNEYNIFSPNDIEEKPLISKIIKEIKEVKPNRIFIDCITHLKYITQDTYKFRKKVLSLIRYIVDNNITVLITSENSEKNPDNDMQFISDGIINLEITNNERYLNISKYRGSEFDGGNHSLRLNERGMQVFPRIKAKNFKKNFKLETISSGVPELDELFYGGIERGTDTIISGPSGVGKTTLGMQFMKEAAGRGERSVIFTFEEGIDTLIIRYEKINIPIKSMIEKENLEIINVAPHKYSPDEFSYIIRKKVEEEDTKIVMIDSISGFRLSFKNSNNKSNNEIVEYLHSLLDYLKNMGVTVLLINEVEDIVGNFKATDIGISYLADNIIFLRYIEYKGKLKKAIGVLKKRLTDFEKGLREFKITKYGIKVGEPLNGLLGILSGNLRFINEKQE